MKSLLNVDNLILGSSNQSKIQEYINFGLKIKTAKIPDLREVNGSELDVIIHKVVDLNQDNVLVEDSTLTVQDANIGVNTKWLLNDLKSNNQYQGKKASWHVYIGLLQGDNVFVFKSQIDGIISQDRKNENGFGFDSVFIPDGQSETLYELKEKGLKDNYSARKNSILKVLEKNPDVVLNKNQISKWTGPYQNE